MPKQVQHDEEDNFSMIINNKFGITMGGEFSIVWDELF